MKNNITKKQENDLLELIGHFILTKPVLAKNLLSKYGVKFSFNPSMIDLSNEYVELLSTNKPAFNKELTHLLNQHIEAKNDEIRAIATNDEEEFWGAVAKIGGSLLGKLGGKLFGKKKKSPQAPGGGAASNLAAQMQMQQKMAQMEAERRRREEEERRRRREEEDRRKREEAAKQKAGQSKMMMMGIGVIALLGIGAFVMKSKSTPVVVKSAA